MTRCGRTGKCCSERCSRELFSLPETIVFYGLSNTHYRGKKRGDLWRYGRSKQQRRGGPLATLAPTLDSAGIPRNCDILPGNVSEPETLQKAMDYLEVSGPTVILDAGIARPICVGSKSGTITGLASIGARGRLPPTGILTESSPRRAIIG